jgi:hypothetical protein
MLPTQLELTPITLISRQFGQMFSKSLLEIAPETWAGPVESGYGLHLVYVEKQVAGYLLPLPEIRDVVEHLILTPEDLIPACAIALYAGVLGS